MTVAIALNYTFTRSVKQAFCGIAIYRHHLNLGFYRGAELSDPKKFLEGDGKLHGHLKFAKFEDPDRPYVRPSASGDPQGAIRILVGLGECSPKNCTVWPEDVSIRP